jgi:nucleoside-triphosphatase THEP1
MNNETMRQGQSWETRFRGLKPRIARVIVLTGERGVGKSTVCCEIVALARARGYTCGGIITLSRPNGARDLLDVRSNDVRRLTLAPDAKPAVVQGRFRFDPKTLEWGNATLACGFACDLLVVDELGPLEIERGGGWQSAFEALHRANFALALVVVRPELVVRAQIRLPSSATTMIAVTLQNRDRLPAIFLEILKRDA